jgi:hypothetical protein
MSVNQAINGYQSATDELANRTFHSERLDLRIVRPANRLGNAINQAFMMRIISTRVPISPLHCGGAKRALQPITSTCTHNTHIHTHIQSNVGILPTV